MVCDGDVEDYEDVPLNSNEHARVEICKMINGNEILAVHDNLFYY